MLINLANLDQWVSGFVLVFFRVAGLMTFAPLFGSARVPRRFKILIALVIAMSMLVNGVPATVHMPSSIGQLTVGLVGELCFGFTLGLVVSLVFIAAQWAGEMVGQQIGMNISEVLDPQFGGGGTIISDLYFMLTTAAFLLLGGHRTLILAVHESLITCPPLSAIFTERLFDIIRNCLAASTALALRLAAPMFVTMITVDVAMGCISKTVPQLNVMSAGMAVRGMLGMIVLAMGIGTVAITLNWALKAHLNTMWSIFH